MTLHVCTRHESYKNRGGLCRRRVSRRAHNPSRSSLAYVLPNVPSRARHVRGDRPWSARDVPGLCCALLANTCCFNATPASHSLRHARRTCPDVHVTCVIERARVRVFNLAGTPPSTPLPPFSRVTFVCPHEQMILARVTTVPCWSVRSGRRPVADCSTASLVYLYHMTISACSFSLSHFKPEVKPRPEFL